MKFVQIRICSFGIYSWVRRGKYKSKKSTPFWQKTPNSSIEKFSLRKHLLRASKLDDFRTLKSDRNSAHTLWRILGEADFDKYHNLFNKFWIVFNSIYNLGWSCRDVTSEDVRLIPLISGRGKQCRLMGTVGVARGLGMAIQVVEFSSGGTKLERFWLTNQNTQKKLSDLENWCNGKLSKIGQHFSNKVV